jgi:hypothetical protein
MRGKTLPRSTHPPRTHKEKETRQALIYGAGYIINHGATPGFQVRVIRYSASLLLHCTIDFWFSGSWSLVFGFLLARSKKSLTSTVSVQQ